MNQDRRPGLAESLRGMLHSGVDVLRTRLELFVIEAQEEKERLVSLLINGILCAVLLSFGVVFLAVFLTVLFWDNHRLLVLGLATLGLIGGAVFTATNVMREIKQGGRPFDATISELERDREALRRRP